jgi:CheY-like chemotaxis protein
MDLVAPLVSNQDRILIVDDNNSIKESLTWVLEGKGYTVITAGNGKDALALLQRKQMLPNLILLDVMMPIMNGWQFLEEKRLNQRLKNIPTVISTDKTNLESQDFHPHEYFLPKPFDIEELISLIKEKARKSNDV